MPAQPSYEPTQQPPRQRPSRPLFVLLIAALVSITVAAWVGDALTTTWAEDHPLPLVLLTARNRVLVLATNQLDAVTYYLAAGFRLLVADPVFYVLGWFYGDAAVRWLERRSPSYGSLARSAEQLFAKAGYPIVFIAPNAYVCLFAGAAGMPVAAFLAVNMAGTAVRLYLIRRVGEAFESPLDSVLDFFRQYRWPLLALSIVLVAFTIWNERRQGRSELGAITRLEEELEAEEKPEN
ncbi:MAG: DedA family protein [Acidimicrobiales bacterium]